jgi:streptomycin 6-kinase
VRSDHVRIPGYLRDCVPRIFGPPGERWLDALPALAIALADRWELGLGSAYTGGTHALVLAVTRADGSPAALKIPMLDDENYAEPRALRAYRGEGAVLLYDHDPESGAMLLERAEPGTSLETEPRREEALSRALARWRRLRRSVPAAEAEHYPSARTLATRWSTDLPARQRRLRLPEFDRIVGYASDLAARFAAASDGPALLINRDGHLGNILRAQREWCLLIDPKPLIGEAAFEGGHPVIRILQQAGPGTTGAAAVSRVAVGLGVDPDRLRGWALLRAVDNACWAAESGADPTPHLAVVHALAHGRQ